jgi:hypothetical protein
MASLYILQSETTGQFYVGSTNELDGWPQERGRRLHFVSARWRIEGCRFCQRHLPAVF